MTVILPTYNEGENIVGLLTRIRTEVPEAHILVVDDSSPDGTAALAREVGKDLGFIDVVTRHSKDGLGSAYRFAFERLFSEREQMNDDVIVTMDADCSHDPIVIPRMIDSVRRGADAVIGSRYIPGGGTVNWPLHRKVLSKWGNRYTGWILRVSVKDCTSGYRAYRLEALKAIEPHSTTAEGYAFLTELVVRLTRQHRLIEETPIVFMDRTAGASKMSSRIILESMTLVTKWGVTQRLKRILRRQS